MSSSDQSPGPNPAKGSEHVPGQPTSIKKQVIDMGTEMLQSLKPIKHASLHGCTFAIYSHDMSRQIETHHFCSRLNQDFVQCAVYDSDDSNARLIGIEYIISDKIFDTLPPEEQKLWHSHAYEIKSGIWVNPRVPELVGRPELQNLTKTYGKFWCTWQADRGDRLPLGAPALMMSPQAVSPGVLKPELLQQRDTKYSISPESLKSSRMELQEPHTINPMADYWKQNGKGFAVDFQDTEMKLRAAFP
ncbi:oil body-associated protein 2C-like [Senna tora]|uniref:Oil body-associated protein 2C-like n=1 Tax=Senna tora TaxID=362788 RepID=A0A834X9K5_9FABA|nr:oil body-associated protein 2C-like [Senna tora]